MADNPAVVEAQVMDGCHEPQYEVQEKRTKRSSKKKPKASRHIELMEWLPTLPQLFAYMGFTQFLLFFWVFIGVCAADVSGTWNIVMMWITVFAMTCLFLVYNFLLAKKHLIKSLTATVFGFILFLFMFVIPIGVLYTSDSEAGQAVFYFVRMLVLGIALVIYCIAYIEDLKGEGGRVVVVETITNKEAQ